MDSPVRFSADSVWSYLKIPKAALKAALFFSFLLIEPWLPSGIFFFFPFSKLQWQV